VVEPRVVKADRPRGDEGEEDEKGAEGGHVAPREPAEGSGPLAGEERQPDEGHDHGQARPEPRQEIQGRPERREDAEPGETRDGEPGLVVLAEPSSQDRREHRVAPAEERRDPDDEAREDDEHAAPNPSSPGTPRS